jgi:hypothetical protein
MKRQVGIRVSSWRAWALVSVLSSLIVGVGCSGSDLEVDESVATVEQQLAVDGSLDQVTDHATTKTYGVLAGTALTSARFVTVGKIGTGTFDRIGIVLWRLNDDGSMTELSSITAPNDVSSKASVARVDDHRFVIAVRSSGGNYYLAAFAVDPKTNAITQTDVEQRGGIKDISITSMNPAPGDLKFYSPASAVNEGYLVVAHQGSSDSFGLSSYSLDASGQLTLRDTASTGDVSGMQVTTVPGVLPAAAFVSRQPKCITNPNHDDYDPNCGTEDDNLNCGDTEDNDKDGFVDCSDRDCCGSSACASSPACQQGMVVTATTGRSTTTLKLISWRIGATGAIERLSEAWGSGANKWDISGAGFRRVATVGVLTDGQPEAATWDVDAAGNITQHSTYTPARTAANVRIVNGGGARLYMLGAESSGAAFLMTLENIDKLRALERTNLSGTFWAKSGDILSLSGDRVVLPNVDAGNKLRLVAFRDYNQPLVRGSYSVSGLEAPGTDSGTGFVKEGAFDPPQDASIAVGEKFVLACNNGRTAVHDRAGNHLGTIGHGSLFSSLISPTVGSPPTVNEHSVNRHLPFQHNCDATAKGSSDDSTNQCITDFFDTRCAYDMKTKRFVTMSMMRWHLSGRYKDRLQRLIAIGVSKTDDPRDGFFTYATTDNKYDDNPLLAATGGMAIITHQASDNDGADSIPEETLRPPALVFDIAGMSAGQTDPVTTKIGLTKTEGYRTLRVAGSGGLTSIGALYSDTDQGVQMFFFGKPGRGPVTVFRDHVALPVTGKIIHNGYLHIDTFAGFSNPPFYSGHLYLPDQIGSEIRVQDLSIKATVANSTFSGIDAAFAASKELASCGGFHGGLPTKCVLPALVADSEKIVAVYGEYTPGLSACGCSSGYCDNLGECREPTVFPRVWVNKFTTPLATSPDPVARVLASGPAPDLSHDSDGWDRGASYMDRSSAVLDPASKDVWALHSTTESRCDPKQSCDDDYDDWIIRLDY